MDEVCLEYRYKAYDAPDPTARRGVKRESTVAGGHLMSKEG